MGVAVGILSHCIEKEKEEKGENKKCGDNEEEREEEYISS
jgi:hypothetical protein